jgi:hypothetical protein
MIRSDDNPVLILNQEAAKRLFSSIYKWVNWGCMQTSYDAHARKHKALNMAIVATNAEKEEKALVREDRGTSAKVFTVRGGRGGIPGNRY